jgi:hypothetical protein
MLEPVQYRNKETQSGTGMLQCWTEIQDAGMPMPVASTLMLMPSYAERVQWPRVTSSRLILFKGAKKIIFFKLILSMCLMLSNVSIILMLSKHAQYSFNDFRCMPSMLLKARGGVGDVEAKGVESEGDNQRGRSWSRC